MKRIKFFAFLLLAASTTATLTSCKDDNDDDDNALTSATAFKVTGTVNGQSINTANGDASASWSGNQGEVIFGGSTVVYETAVRPSPSVDNPSLRVRLGAQRYADNDFDDQAKFYDYFRTGVNEFTFGIDEGAENTERKVDIVYVDANGDTWSSDRGSAAQAGSTFEITEILKTDKPNGYVLKFRAKVKCNLYNDEGTMIAADISEFVGQVETYEE